MGAFDACSALGSPMPSAPHSASWLRLVTPTRSHRSAAPEPNKLSYYTSASKVCSFYKPTDPAYCPKRVQAIEPPGTKWTQVTETLPSISARATCNHTKFQGVNRPVGARPHASLRRCCSQPVSSLRIRRTWTLRMRILPYASGRRTFQAWIPSLGRYAVAPLSFMTSVRHCADLACLIRADKKLGELAQRQRPDWRRRQHAVNARPGSMVGQA